MLTKLRSIFSVAALMIMTGLPTAMAMGPYQNTTPGGFSNAVNSCTGTPLVRTIFVADSFTISDLDVGLIIDHTWRLDTRATLQSPSGTSVVILDDNGGNGPQLNRYNVRLDDEGSPPVNTGSHGNDPATPQFGSRVQPDNPLSAFDGQNAQGTWTLSLCDVFSADDGTFQIAELFFSEEISTAPPVLTCGSSATRFDWNNNAWPAGSFTNTYAHAGEDLRVTIAGSTGSLLTDPETGAQTPVTSTYYTGGQGLTQRGLFSLANYPNNTSAISYTIDVGDLSSGSANNGVGEMQFSFFDVDFGASAFQDLLTITATNGTNSVTPIISPSTANSTTGNTAVGEAGAGRDTGDGTVTVTFLQRVTSVTVTYGSGAQAPTNPNNQGVALYDILTCPTTTAVLQASKTNKVHDDLYALPGNDVVYTIAISNIGTGPTDDDSIVLIDSMPSEVSFFRGSLASEAVTFAETGATGLDFVYSRDVGYSNAATKPANFSQCSYAPTAGYDSAVSFICFNPKDALAAGTSFEFEFRARIN